MPQTYDNQNSELIQHRGPRTLSFTRYSTNEPWIVSPCIPDKVSAVAHSPYGAAVNAVTSRFVEQGLEHEGVARIGAVRRMDQS